LDFYWIEAVKSMHSTAESISSELKRLSSVLRQLEQRLPSETEPDPAILNEFRQAVDNVRLTAWTVSELINAKQTRKNPDAVLSFVAAERLRRFGQLVNSLSEDIEHRVVTLETHGVESLIDSVGTLQRHLKQSRRNQGSNHAENARSKR
jgi:hypothetical protein